jgi:hypothetical protein
MSKDRDLFGFFKRAASIEGAELNMEAPGYQESSEESRSCGTCKYRSPEGKCAAYNFNCAANFVCDTWASADTLF